MDETGITMMAFPRGNKDYKATLQQSFQDEGLRIYCITLSKSLSLTHTTYTSNAQHINKNPLNSS